jgi:hypothetical protein
VSWLALDDLSADVVGVIRHGRAGWVQPDGHAGGTARSWDGHEGYANSRSRHAWSWCE